MRYGRFSEDSREYIIDHVASPRPWINYLYNRDYFTLISASGGGMSYHKTPLHGRITRYRINDVPPDRPGKYIYARDRSKGRYWSLTWQPAGRAPEAYRVRHGFGYTVAQSEVEGIASETLFFVHPEQNMEIWKVKMANCSAEKKMLTIFGYVELCLGHALIDLINQCDDQHFNRVHFDKSLNAILATKTYWVTQTRGTQHQENQEWDQWVFFACSEPVVGYETLRERFIGPYRSESNPAAVEAGILSSRGTDYGNAVGALQVEIELAPGQSRELLFRLGVIPKADFSQKKEMVLRTCATVPEAEAAWESVKARWKDFFSYLTVAAPDPDVNIFVNYWTPYQARVAFDVGRLASFYYWGIGRGLGFRDTAQDILAVTMAEPERARERVRLLSRQMFTDGRVFHHFWADGQGETTGHCDDPLWFVLAVTEYIKETGDVSILDEPQPFVGAAPAPILDHLKAAVRFAANKLGPHGLPIFGRGDWNDTLDYIGGDEGGESVWGAMFYAAMLNRLLELLAHIGEKRLYRKAAALRDRLQDAVNRHCWDGEWFIRAFGAKNRRIGSRKNEFGKIFINSQSWAVIAGISGTERLLQAMDSVRRYLDTPFGPKICAPAFRRIDPSIGLITRCVPGKKENAAVFLHTTAWVIQAECLLGRGNQAFDYYKKLLPNAVDSDTFQSEPYVYSQYITSDEHPSAGQASHSWQTGTAAWMFRVMADYFFGVRPTYTGLLIDPVVPASWREFRVERVFRGCRYLIDIQNPDGVEHGVKSISIGGRPISGNILPVTTTHECRVDVIMGEK